MNIVKEVEKIVKGAAYRDTNVYGISAWTIHIQNVLRYSRILAKKRKINLEQAELAALFHDYAALINKNYSKNHHIYGAKEAEKILNHLKYRHDKISDIKEAIFCHRGSKKIRKNSKLAKCLADADALAHFNEIYDLFYLAYARHKMESEEGKEFVKDKLQRSWQKLSPDARKLIKKEYRAAKEILK